MRALLLAALCSSCSATVAALDLERRLADDRRLGLRVHDHDRLGGHRLHRDVQRSVRERPDVHGHGAGRNRARVHALHDSAHSDRRGREREVRRDLRGSLMRALLILALCSSCTFVTVARESHTHPPSVPLSPAMARLDREAHRTPWYVPAIDIALFMGGAAAGPATENEPINLAGLALTGLVFASLGATVALWGHL